MENRKEQFQEQGYFICKGFFSKEEIALLNEEVRCAKPRFPSLLNRKGLVFSEHIHFRSLYLQSFLSQKKVVYFLKEFIGPSFWVRKDQLVTKFPEGEEFPWHQDNGYNTLQDAYYQFWIPLTNINAKNGGLWLAPGSHKNGLLPHVRIGTHLQWQGKPHETVSIEVDVGDVLLFSSLLLHRSGANQTNTTRLAYVVEFMSSNHFDPYIRPPYYRVAKNGVPNPKFVYFYEGNLNLGNQLKYVFPRIRRRVRIIRGNIRESPKKFFQRLGKGITGV